MADTQPKHRDKPPDVNDAPPPRRGRRVWVKRSALGLGVVFGLVWLTLAVVYPQHLLINTARFGLIAAIGFALYYSLRCEEKRDMEHRREGAVEAREDSGR